MVSAKKLAVVGVLCGFVMTACADEQKQGASQQVAQKAKLVNPKDNPLFFVDVKFETFVARVVPKESREDFTRYYASFLKQADGMNETDTRKVKAVYYDRAIAGLQKNRPEWFKTLQTYYGNPLVTLDPKFEKVRMVIGSFLVRYGVYEDYNARKAAKVAQADTGLWGTISSMGTTVAGWFGFGKEEPTQVTA